MSSTSDGTFDRAFYDKHSIEIKAQLIWFKLNQILTFERAIDFSSNEKIKKKGIIVAVPGYYNEFLFWREANVIRRYLWRTTFVPSKFLCRIMRGRGGLLSFGVNLRVQGLLSVDAFCAIVYTDNFIKWIH